jgi:hypothetical protein
MSAKADGLELAILTVAGIVRPHRALSRDARRELDILITRKRAAVHRAHRTGKGAERADSALSDARARLASAIREAMTPEEEQWTREQLLAEKDPNVWRTDIVSLRFRKEFPCT